jgi:hypothetical protein
VSSPRYPEITGHRPRRKRDVVPAVADATVVHQACTWAMVGEGTCASEVGAGWHRYAERRRTERIASDARVFDAAEAACNVAEGLRWLIGVDIAKASHGEGISHDRYEAMVMDLSLELRRLRQAPLTIGDGACAGPCSRRGLGEPRSSLVGQAGRPLSSGGCSPGS